MLDKYKSNYYPIWTSASDINFTRCFFGVNYEPTHETILGTAIQYLLICHSSTEYEPRPSQRLFGKALRANGSARGHLSGAS